MQRKYVLTYLHGAFNVIVSPGALKLQAALVVTLLTPLGCSFPRCYLLLNSVHEQADKDSIQNINKDGCQEDRTLRVLGESLLHR